MCVFCIFEFVYIFVSKCASLSVLVNVCFYLCVYVTKTLCIGVAAYGCPRKGESVCEDACV